MIKTILIDDEERAINTLTMLLSTYVPEIEIVATCNNVPAGVIAINQHRPNLVFLDIEMPEYNGFELLSFFRDVDFEIIFVTAYSEYAVRAFEISAIDYILKPVEVDLLLSAMERFQQKKLSNTMQDRLDMLKENITEEEVKRIALPMNDGLVFIELKDIILIEAEGSYARIITSNGSTLVVSKRLKFFEDLLASRALFFRPHRSFIINLNYVKKYVKGESAIVLDGQHIISLSRERKQEFESRLKELRFMY